MDHKKTNRIVAFAVFAITLATYIYTLPPTVVFWDVPEHCAASYSLQVQHPPGSPLLVLVMHIASMIPFAADIAVRMHFFNALASAFVVTLLYLITVRVILLRHPLPEKTFERVVVYGSAAIGALALTFSTTFWFNAIETETRNMSLLFTALTVWLALRWHDEYEKPHSDAYLLLIAFFVGLTTGIHIHGLLGFFVAILVVYFRFYKHSLRHFLFSIDILKFGAVASLVFFSAYPGIVKWFPTMLAGELFGIQTDLWIVVAIALPLLAFYGLYYSVKHKRRILNIASLSFLFVLLGYSIYAVVFIRANADTPMNENDPSTMKRMVTYLEREQYGSTPLMQRRWSNEPDKMENFKKYTSDMDYFLSYQINHMYLRYFGWNFIGKVDDWQGAGVKFSQLWGIPFLIGLIGFAYHWKIDSKMAFIMTIFFVLTGLALAFYFNMQQEQPRERDYFFVYSFFAFSLWIGMGALAIVNFLEQKFTERVAKTAGYGVLAATFLLVPLNMLRTNLHPSSRRGHYVAWDYAYNLLQSTEKDAILITNGDNDTFPLWYLQDVEGVRRDVRIVNLSLVNMDWYIKQLKNNEPYGAKKVPISLTNEQITNIGAMEYEPQVMSLPVPRNAAEGWDLSGDSQHSTIAGGADSAKKAALRTPGADGLEIVDTVKFLMPATIQFSNIKGLRVQDIIVFDIVRTSNWQRPIYFATTGGDDGKIGLSDYMETRGLAVKLVPRRSAAFWANVNENAMRRHLMTDVTEFSKTPAFGFRWRGLQDPTVHFDENQRRLLLNYRNSFLTFALFETQVKRAPAEAKKILDRMEQVIPRAIIPIDYRFKSDIAQIYKSAGDMVNCRAYALELANDLIGYMTTTPAEPINQYNPLIMMYQAYELAGEYDKAIGALDRIVEVYGKEPGVAQFVAGRKAEIMASRGK